MSENEQFTATLRERVREAMSPCPTCGSPRGATLRAIAGELGVVPSTLTRFVSQGKQPSGPLVNKIVTWLEQRKVAKEAP